MVNKASRFVLGAVSWEDLSTSEKEPAKEWAEVKDPQTRRKIQNKLAQRRFRKYLPLLTFHQEAQSV